MMEKIRQYESSIDSKLCLIAGL